MKGRLDCRWMQVGQSVKRTQRPCRSGASTGSGASVITSIDVSSIAGVTRGVDGMIAGGADTATIINGMLNDHSLKDTV